MQDNAFGAWLKNVDGRPPRQMSDNVARVRRVERAGYNLDTEYEKNRCTDVLNELITGSTLVSSSSELPKDCAGLSSLKTAVRKYVSFRDYTRD